MTAQDYPPLPPCLPGKAFMNIYTADQMRAYVDADRALRAPQGEPVAWADSRDLAKDGNWDTFIVKHDSEMHEGLRFNTPLYTHPAHTEADIHRLARDCFNKTPAELEVIISRILGVSQQEPAP